MIIRDERESLEEKAAWIIADLLEDLLSEQERAVLALPGGRSVAGVFEHLREQPLEWSRVHVFMVDERLVPLDDEQSNFRLLKQHLLSADVPQDNIHPFRTDEGVRSYERELQALGGRFDVVLLSAGEDGHVAGLFPGHGSVEEEGVFVKMDDAPKPPPGRMSASRSLLEGSQAGVVLFFGDGKREALRSFMEDGPAQECPARLVRRLPRWFALTDLEE